MTNRQFTKDGQSLVCTTLILHRAADGDIFIAIAPILWQTTGYPLWPLGDDVEVQVTPTLNHQPSFFAPSITLIDKEV